MKIELEEWELRRIIGALYPPSMFGSELIDKLKSYLPPDPLRHPRQPEAPIHLVPPPAKPMNWVCPKCGKHIVHSAREDNVACVVEHDEKKWETYPDRCVEFYK